MYYNIIFLNQFLLFLESLVISMSAPGRTEHVLLAQEDNRTIRVNIAQVRITV